MTLWCQLCIYCTLVPYHTYNIHTSTPARLLPTDTLKANPPTNSSAIMQVLGAPHVAYPQYPAFRICHATSHIAHHTGRPDELRQKSSSGAKGGSILHYSSSNSKCKPMLRIKHSLLLHMWRSHWSCTQRSAATVGRHAKLISERRVHLCRALRQQRLSRS